MPIQRSESTQGSQMKIITLTIFIRTTKNPTLKGSTPFLLFGLMCPQNLLTELSTTQSLAFFRRNIKYVKMLQKNCKINRSS